MPDPGWWEALWPDPARVLVDVGIANGMRVIDLCCGDGWFTLPLAKIARTVIAIDIDGKLLDAAKVRFAERGGAPNVVLIEADAYAFVGLQPPQDVRTYEIAKRSVRVMRPVGEMLDEGRKLLRRSQQSRIEEVED